MYTKLKQGSIRPPNLNGLAIKLETLKKKAPKRKIRAIENLTDNLMGHNMHYDKENYEKFIKKLRRTLRKIKRL